MITELKFKVIEFSYENKNYALLTHDWLPCQAYVQDCYYDVKLIDTYLYKGPEAWVDIIMEDMIAALIDIQLYYLLDFDSLYYNASDLQMICNTYSMMLNNFNKFHNIIQNTR